MTKITKTPQTSHRGRIQYWFASALMVTNFALIPLWSSAASALVKNPEPAARVSFTFDDGLTSAVTNVLPTLSKYGLTGTAYVITKCVGMSAIPNTCHANTDASYMTWAQIKQLQSAGWEIGSHTSTHPYLASSDASDGQPNLLTPAQVIQELTDSKNDLAAQGINANAFSTPYGDYTNATLAQIAKLYTSHRGFADQDPNNWPYNDYLLNNMQVQAGVSITQVKNRIDRAIANKEWLILTLHDVLPNPSNDPDDYQYSVGLLDQIAAYVKSKQDAGLAKTTNVSDGLVTSDTNMLPNSSFDSGIGSGWTTDAPLAMTLDTNGNGNYPNSTNSIKLVSQLNQAHLFSPLVTVNSSTTYMFKSFLNVNKISAGEVAFYVDEYDANNNWVSGQYKTAERSAFTESMNFSYKPTSATVKKASLQVIATGNSGITAYLDNVQMFALNSVQVPPTPNLLVNGAFDSGISSGWTTDDPTNITFDTANHGAQANPANSIALKSTTKNIQLFSPKVTVDSTKSYTLTNYVNLLTLSNGEIGFYIDEYDANGNWISGKYVSGVRNVSNGDVTLSYKPSSANVKSASLQVIVVANSGITGYFDDARWTLDQ